MESLQTIETTRQKISTDRVAYDPIHIQAQIAIIRQREAEQEPWKSKPQILEARLDAKLLTIPNGQ